MAIVCKSAHNVLSRGKGIGWMSSDLIDTLPDKPIMRSKKIMKIFEFDIEKPSTSIATHHGSMNFSF
jgi:hypothetical protein